MLSYRPIITKVDLMVFYNLHNFKKFQEHFDVILDIRKRILCLNTYVVVTIAQPVFSSRSIECLDVSNNNKILDNFTFAEGGLIQNQQQTRHCKQNPL